MKTAESLRSLSRTDVKGCDSGALGWSAVLPAEGMLMGRGLLGISLSLTLAIHD